MLRLKSFFAIAVMIAAVGAAQTAHAAATLKVLMIGASGTWQAMAIGTYKAGACPTGAVGGCGNATYGSVNVIDTRGTGYTDTGATVWVVWDHATSDPTCATACNYWAYVKVDSVVGTRCYFATPRCEVQITGSPAGPANKITLGSSAGAQKAWPTEQQAPAPILTALEAGTLRVQVGVSEIRPEDAAFAQCRINSTLGGGNDGLNGLGYGANGPGVCPAFGSANVAGTDLVTAYPGGTSTAHPIAFNISGHDPITNSTVPAFTSVSLGAEPLIFITNRLSATGLASVSNVSLSQLQTVFSGTSCKASDLGGGADSIHVFLREPLSGTSNGAEYTAFRLPRDASGNYAGKSQYTGWNDGAGNGLGTVAHPGFEIACTAGGDRSMVVGNGDETNFIRDSNSATIMGAGNALDGIGYMFFSYGNVSAFKDNTQYSYLQISGMDPIWEKYTEKVDPAQPAVAGELPGAADLPNLAPSGLGGGCLVSGVLGFPCPETRMWKGQLSFPSVRSGQYRQWIIARLFGATGSTPLVNAQALVTSAQASAVTTVPDFIPVAAVTATISGVAFTDPGVKLLRSHYTQDGVAPANLAPDAGGDEGGCILAPKSTATKLVQRETGCVLGQ